MIEKQQQSQEPVRSVKETRSESVQADTAKLPASSVRGAGKWALGVPIGDLGEDELIEMASTIGNSSMLALLRGVAGVEMAEPYRLTAYESGDSEVESAISVGFPGGDEAFNEIASAAPELMSSFSFGHMPVTMKPFAVDAMLSRSEGANGINIFAESFEGAL